MGQGGVVVRLHTVFLAIIAHEVLISRRVGDAEPDRESNRAFDRDTRSFHVHSGQRANKKGNGYTVFLTSK